MMEHLQDHLEHPLAKQLDNWIDNTSITLTSSFIGEEVIDTERISVKLLELFKRIDYLEKEVAVLSHENKLLKQLEKST